MFNQKYLFMLNATMGKNFKQWKSDGDEDKFIIGLIRQGKVNKYTKPASLKTDYPQMFDGFSVNVVRNHLNALKRSNGMDLDEQSDSVEDSVEEQSEDIKDWAYIDSLASQQSFQSSTTSIVHNNYPYLCEIYKNPENQMDMVILVVCVPGGARDIKMELNDDGVIATIKYRWPNVICNMEDLFKKPLATSQVTIHHPKILSINAALQNLTNGIDNVPESEIQVRLPIRVQSTPNSWTKRGVSRDDGSQIVIAEFLGYVEDYNKKLYDSSVLFE